MYPYLEIFGKSIPTYGLLGILGFLLALLYIIAFSKRFGLAVDDLLYVYVFGALGAVVGSKVFFWIVNIPDLIRLFQNHAGIREIGSFFISGGFVFYGGLIGALLAGWLTAKYFHFDFPKYLPILVPAICIFHCIGRVGCFLSGCCFGKPTNSFIGIAFTDSITGVDGVKLIPIQLIEAAGILIIFIILHVYANSNFSIKAFEKNPVKRNKSGLYLLFLYIMCYGTLRFVDEFFRGDTYRGLWGPFSTSQWVSLILMALAMVWKLFFDKKQQKK